jgi:hypothetical protein
MNKKGEAETMSKEDQPNGKITKAEMEVLLADMLEKMPYLMESAQHTGKILKAKYDGLVKAGFSEKDALHIVSVRPLYE